MGKKIVYKPVTRPWPRNREPNGKLTTFIDLDGFGKFFIINASLNPPKITLLKSKFRIII